MNEYTGNLRRLSMALEACTPTGITLYTDDTLGQDVMELYSM